MAPYRAVAEIVSGDSRILSGEGVRLRCSVPDARMSNWHYRWFQGSKMLGDRGQILELWSARIDDTSKYSCQGVRDTAVGEVHTLQSLPVEILVDGEVHTTSNILAPSHYPTTLATISGEVEGWELLSYPNTVG